MFGVVFAVVFQALAQSPSARIPAQHTFAVSGNQFLMDGKPYQVISGEMHYPRVPRAYWRDRFRKARAMGLNTITTYVFWNLHEPTPGVFDFSGQNDVAEYIREAQQEGLNVILRPGPYVCAEWELGGYPSWLLKDPSLVLRSSDPKYSAAVKAWFTRLGKEIQPLLQRNGGPIIAVQVENEYGSFGNDRAYMEGVKQQLIDSGMGDALLYTADGPEQMSNDYLQELPSVVNFGTGDAQKAFATLTKVRPEGPKMSGEYWAGWFDHWGEKHHATDGQKEAAELRWMLEQGYSISMYMFEGGTSFGWMNGANSNGTNYEPDTTSYDYDAPLDEAGRPRQKYFYFQDAIHSVTGAKLPDLPKETPRAAFPVGQQMKAASLWKNLPSPVTSEKPLTFEDLNQAYGYVLYRTDLRAGEGGMLVLDGLHDYAQVYVNQQLVGSLDRRLSTNTLEIPRQTHPATLDILVENTGRVNYTKVIRTERKGLTGTVTLDGRQPASWKIFSLPMSDPSQVHFLAEPCTGPCFLQTSVSVDQPADTYIDTSALHKGFVWIEKQPLGRVWSIGPQHALYTPGSWLHSGQNVVTVFDLNADPQDRLSTRIAPNFDATISTRE